MYGDDKMSQIHGSGTGNWANTAIVDGNGRLFVNTIGSANVTNVAPDNLPIEIWSGNDLVGTHHNTLGVINDIHFQTSKGNVYAVTLRKDDVATNGSVGILVETGSCGISTFIDGITEGNWWIDIYEHPTLTDSGTAITAFNLNRQYAGSIWNGSIWDGPTVTVTGTHIYQGAILTERTYGNFLSTDYWHFNPGSDYVIQLRNKEASAKDGVIDFVFIEECT